MLDQLKASAINYFQKNSSVIILNAIKVLGLALILSLAYGVYKFLTAFLPTSISILIILALVHKLVRTICRIGTFPGSTWYWRRNIENYFQKAYVNKMKKRITTLRALVEYILEERHWNGFCNVDELTHIRKTIASTLLIFQKQVTHDTLNKKQRELMNQFTDIEQTLNDLKICTRPDNRTFTMWNFLEQRERFIEQPKTILYFGDKNQGNFLLNKCTELEERLTDIVAKKKWYKSLKRWAFEETFGTLDQLREELDMRYKCRPMSLRTDKDVLLDGMLVYGKHSKEERHSMFEKGGNTRTKPQEIKRDQPSDKTIIFCCPNAGYYEYMFCENEWVELYLRNGFNVLLWNYRGFGRSTGSPTPNGFRRDGEAVVDFLRKDLGMKKIGVHGESLGGIVTTHLGRAKNIDYMCADRTFASLSSVAEISFGASLAKIFRLSTLWDDQIARDYLQANCYKIITCDPKDEIIHMMASLKYGVTSRIIQQKLGYKDVIPTPNLMEDRSSWVFRIGGLFSKFILAVKREFQFKQIKQGISEYSELLSKDQMLALYCAFNRICELFDTLASLNALNTRKKNSGGRPKPQMSKPTQPGRSGSETTADGEDARQRNVSKGQVTSPDEGISFVNETRGLNESLDPKGSSHSDDSDIMESIHKKSYHEEFNAAEQSQEKVVDLLVKIFGVFEDLEAGGVFMSDVMSVKEKLRFTAFQHFIHSFKIWGSYYPLLGVIEKGCIDHSYYQANAADKLKHFNTKIDKILQKQRQDITRKNSKLIQLVLDDLEVISSLMPTLYQRLVAKNTNPLYTGATNSSRFNSSKQQEIELELGPNKDTQHMLRTAGGYTDLESSIIEDHSNIGHLIPLTCGHNGTPRPLEIQLFEYLLLRSGLVE